MRLIIVLPVLLLAACEAETGFQTNSEDNATSQESGKMEVYPGDLTWTDLTVGIDSSEYMKITSVGEEPLRVYDIAVVDSADGQFSMAAVDEFELQPGEDIEFSVQCRLSAEAEAVGELRIRNTDPDQSDLRLTLTASPVGGGAETGDTGDTGS